jgi:hypothetical protein
VEEYNEKFNGLYGAYCISGNEPFTNYQHNNCARDYHLNNNREAIFENGERIKYKERRGGEEAEWIFAPGIGWENIPEEAIEEIEKCNCMWDSNGKVIDARTNIKQVYFEI